ncbi:ankyrin repeat-containing domain protein [Lactifluus subvellereus]|nr:ankyrin repeat-containing domain protein [Lactifluus subvellereus]
MDHGVLPLLSFTSVEVSANAHVVLNPDTGGSTADRPNIPVHTLDDYVLLNIFFLYRLDISDDDEDEDYSDFIREYNWYHERWWYKLAQVCRKWRYLILASPSRLGLRLVCARGTPVADMLAHSPPLPLIIDHLHADGETSTEDEDGIRLALQQRDRVCRIGLSMQGQNLQKLIMFMDKEFPVLERLLIVSWSKGVNLTLPNTFQAPHLRRLVLLDAGLPKTSPLLTTTTGLVTLLLANIPESTYLPPDCLVTWFSLMPNLEVLAIGFRSPTPRRDFKELSHTPIVTPITLPNLHWFSFRGVSAYLERLVAQISAPRLKKLQIQFFNQLIFSIPRLVQFISVTENFMFNVVGLIFSENGVVLTADSHEKQRIKPFYMHIMCKHLDWQVASVVQIFRTLLPLLSVVKNLSLAYAGDSLSIGQHHDVNRTQWRELLRPFINIKALHIENELVGQLSHSLQSDDGETPLELLPNLEELTYSGGSNAEGVFTPLINERQAARRPLVLNIVDDSVFDLFPRSQAKECGIAATSGQDRSQNSDVLIPTTTTGTPAIKEIAIPSMARTIYLELTWTYTIFTFLWLQIRLIFHPCPPSPWLCQRPFPAHFLLITSVHTTVAQARLGALLHVDEDVSLKNFPLAKYATKLWMDHAKFENVLLGPQGGRTVLVERRILHFTVWTQIYDPDASWLAQSKCPSQPRGSLLHFVALYGLRGIVELPIVKCSQDVNDRRPFDNKSPLFMASEMGYVGVTRIFPQHGVDADARDDSNWTPLNVALRRGYREVVQVLLDRGVDANVWDNNNWSPLHVALHEGYWEVARVLLELSSNVDILSKDYSTPLHPVSSGLVGVTRALLGGCAAVDAQNWTPLHWASQDGHLAAVAQVLLKHRADAPAQNNDDQTPLHLASQLGPLEVVQALLECSADARARGNDGWIPLHWSLEGRNLDVARVLECGADANLWRKNNQTPLYLASLIGQHLAVAQVLLEEGADAATRDNRAPLHVASRVRHLKIDQILLECGANANAQDEKWAPLHRTSQDF